MDGKLGELSEERSGHLGRLLILVTLSVCISLASTSARASFSYFEPYPPLLIMASPPDLRPGDIVTIDMYTFRAGAPFDADQTPSATFLAGVTSPLEDIARIDVGHYRGSARLPDPPPDPASAGMRTGMVQVAVNISGIPVARYLPLAWYNPGLYVRLSVNETRPAMGASVRVHAEVYDRGEPVTPDNLTVSLRIADSYYEEQVPRHVDNGLYERNFTLPSFYPPYAAVIFNAVAHLGAVEFRQSLDVRVPRYQVWFERSFVTTEALEGVLWVADEEGRPAPGVNLRVVAGGNTVTGTTDDQGRMPVSTALGTAAPTFVLGSVGEGTPMENYFVLTLTIDDPVPEAAISLDPPLMADGTARDFLRPGQTVERRFQLWNRTLTGEVSPFANAPVDVYLWTAREVITSGRVETDASGTLAVSFLAPAEDVSLGFSNGVWPIDVVRYRVASPFVALNISALRLGGVTTVQAKVAQQLKPSNDAQFFAFSTTEVRLVQASQGEKWEAWTVGFAERDLYPAEEGLFHAYGLPVFLPPGGRYLLAVSVFTERGPQTQYAILGEGDDVVIPFNATYEYPDGGQGLSQGALLVIAGSSAAIGILAATAVLIARRRLRPPAMPPQS